MRMRRRSKKILKSGKKLYLLNTIKQLMMNFSKIVTIRHFIDSRIKPTNPRTKTSISLPFLALNTSDKEKEKNQDMRIIRRLMIQLNINQGS